jgi:hypothetical protein
VSGPPSRRSTPTTSPASSDRERAGAGPRLRPLLLLAIGAAFAVVAVYLIVVRTRWGQELDERALLGRDVISDLRAAQADRFLRIVSVGSLTLATALVAAVAFLRGRPRMALIAAASIGLAVLSTELLKLAILDRPPLTTTTLNNGLNSYPSGHTTVGMSVCVAAMLVVPLRLRAATAFAAGAAGGAFGIAVVAAGWHRPSDAVGAYLVCVAAGAVGAIAIRHWPDPVAGHRRRELLRGRVRIGATELGLLALGVSLVAVFGIAALSARGIPLFSVGAGFLVSCGVLLLMSFACAGLLASAMTSADREPEP